VSATGEAFFALDEDSQERVFDEFERDPRAAPPALIVLLGRAAALRGAIVGTPSVRRPTAGELG
jgi:hypothetical protein